MNQPPTKRGLGSGDLDSATEELAVVARNAVAEGRDALASVAYASLAVAHARGGRRDAADQAIGHALQLATQSGHLGAKVMVGWRYVAMLNVLDRPTEARKHAEGLLAGLRDDDPTELRREAHQVSADVAAACGDWDGVRRHSLEVSALAGDDVSARAQGLVGAANAALRNGQHDLAARDAEDALNLALAGELDGLRAAALTTLMSLDRVPDNVDVDGELRAIASRASRGGDTAGEAAARLSLGRWYLDQGHLAASRPLLDQAADAAERGGHTFAWGKILIIRASTQTTRTAAIHDVDVGWRTLTQIVDTFVDPAARQSLLLDWRAMTDAALTALPFGPEPMDEDSADLAVRIFDGMAVDALRESLRATIGEAPEELSKPTDLDSAGDALGRLRARSYRRAILAFRVMRVEQELVAGWRLSLDEKQAIRLERFEVRGAAAFEIKLLAERDQTAPTSEPAVWRRLAAELLPSTWSFLGDNLVVVPHGPLWLVPWGALRLSQHEWLVERTTISLAPSLSSLPAPHSPRPAPATSVVVAIDARMNGGQADAAHVKSRLNDHAVVVTDAEHLRMELSKPRDLLVISAHGNGIGDRWRVELDDGDLLSGSDLAAMPLPPLVIAASCLSGRQTFEPWPPTLVTGCIASGVATLVAGLWDLPDTAASQLVASLVDSLIDTDVPVDTCLRSAQAALARRGATVREWAGLAVFSGTSGDSG